MTHFSPPSPHLSPGEPPPTAIDPDALIADLSSPQFSLIEVAARHSVTLSDLTLLVATPDVSDQLSILHTLATERARLIAISNLPRAIGALSAVMTTIQRGETHVPTSPASAGEVVRGAARTGEGVSIPATQSTHRLSPPSHPIPPVLIARRLETLRRAATTIIQLSRFTPRPWNPIPPSFLAPAPATFPVAPPIHRDPPPVHVSANAEARAIPSIAPASPPAPSPRHIDPALPKSEVSNSETPTAHPAPPNLPPPKSKISNPQISNPAWSPDSDLHPDDPNLVTAFAPHEHWP